MAEGKIKTGRLRIFERALWRKSSRYMVSGLVVIIVGLIVITIGVVYSGGNYYGPPGLLVGAGAITVVVGIIRLFIGFINPASPEDLAPLEESEENTEEDSILPEE